MRASHATVPVEFTPCRARVAATIIREETRKMSDLDSFRSETRDWLEKNCPAEMRQPMLVESDTFWGGRNKTFQSEAQRVWFERIRDKKWVVPHWPAEYGGGGLDPARAK